MIAEHLIGAWQRRNDQDRRADDGRRVDEQYGRGRTGQDRQGRRTARSRARPSDRPHRGQNQGDRGYRDRDRDRSQGRQTPYVRNRSRSPFMTRSNSRNRLPPQHQANRRTPERVQGPPNPHFPERPRSPAPRQLLTDPARRPSLPAAKNGESPSLDQNASPHPPEVIPQVPQTPTVQPAGVCPPTAHVQPPLVPPPTPLPAQPRGLPGHLQQQNKDLRKIVEGNNLDYYDTPAGGGHIVGL
jgi:hypothetical protein